MLQLAQRKVTLLVRGTRTAYGLLQCSAFLSDEQFADLAKYSSSILHAIADAVAQVRVSEFKESLSLTDKQVTSLSLVVSDDLRRIVETFQDYGDRELGVDEADEMNATLAGIRKGTRDGILKILDSTQRKKLEQALAEEKAAESEAE